MHFDINSNSQLSALPYAAMYLTGLVVSPLFDTLVANNTISITVARKISNSLASVLPAAALTCLAFLENFEPNLVNALLIVAVGTSAFQQSGYMLNTIDLTPNHAGTLFGLINGINNIFSLLAPLTVRLLGSDKSDPILWRKVFLLSAGIYIACGLFYAIFTSADVQRWNGTEKEEEKTEKK
ncbi:hypothetical protein Zmor_022825 [Zophobas morio]|uniref:Inorganic phosphate cotransporter n=1 Tax=Zophobas morio TaxID=2755281 RepID=A0AA38M6E9_9CUCU|nr:hypothetical protein Zmor_022825 [Zophobas morio]